MEEFDIGDFELDEEIEIEDFELDVIKIEPIYEELIITPALEVQTKEGSFNKVTVNAIETEEITIIPSKEEQTKEGIYNKVIVNGDDELIPDNIKKGVNIFGVNGNLEIVLTKEEYNHCIALAKEILNETEYQQIEYIESTGTQYIDMGLKLTQNHKLEMTISNFDTNGNRKTFGSRTSATSDNFSVVSGPVGGTMSIVADFHDYKNNRLAYIITEDERLNISINNKLLKINDLEKEVTTYSDFTTPDNAYLFNCSGIYPAGYTLAAMRLYTCKIYENDILVRDFIPVYRKEDGEIGLLDTIQNKFYTNIGTDRFISGEEVI